MKLFRLLLLLNVMPFTLFSQSAEEIKKEQVLATMKRATTFMVEKVSYKGGYVWSYLPDMSRRWGEMEAKPSMIWVQPPGTATMGHLFLDLYHATKDEYYYQAAQKATATLIEGQHPSGGWNYMIDFAGEESLKEWYNTIGANGWRLEEFQHYYGNATFDDGGTAEAAKLMLRMYLERKDSVIKKSLDNALRFVLDSQHEIGGWPQRYPPAKAFIKEGRPDYTSFITFNDDVANENIQFLILYFQALGDKRLLLRIRKAMDAYLAMQMPEPQPGWAMQYSLDLKPAAARSYEPAAMCPTVTESNCYQLMQFYRLTGDAKYLEAIPKAIAWLERIRLPDSLAEGKNAHMLFVELGTDKPLFIHRKGSNVVNGKYYADNNPKNTVSHYRSVRFIDVDSLKKTYDFVKAQPLGIIKNSALLTKDSILQLPSYFTFANAKSSDLNSRDLTQSGNKTKQVKELLESLNKDGYWLTPLRSTTNPYIGSGSKEITPGDYSVSRVGDKYDTSPYFVNTPAPGISTGTFIKNMCLLMDFMRKK